MKEKLNAVIKSVVSFFPQLFGYVFGRKSEKIKNKHLFKRGGYAVAIIALVIAAAIIVNLLVGFLADRITLEFDITSEKKNSISEENKEYIKAVEKDINIFVFASSAEEYYNGGMAQAAQNKMFYTNNSEYYFQTTVLLDQYVKLNDKITLEYVDPNGTEVGAIISEYGTSYSYGDILVTCNFKGEDGKDIKNSRALTLADIYTCTENTEYAAMGVTMYEIDGSSLETALTSAIASVTSAESLKVGFIASHSNSDAFEHYRDLLKMNNITIEDINDKLITEISSDYDAVVIVAPSKDFVKDEITALSEFLANDGKLNKSLLFYGDSSYQNLPNFYNFLSEWGIDVQPGIVFETNDSVRGTDYSTYISLSASTKFPFVGAGQYFASGYNIAMSENDSNYAGRTTETVLATNGTSVVVPIGTDNSKAPGDGYEICKMSSCIVSTESEFVENIPAYSRVIAFSSVDFISELYALSYGSVMDYDKLNVEVMRYATGSRDVSIVFDAKTIDSTAELYVVSSASAKVMRVIFAAIIPLLILAAAFVIFFRRRNK